MIGVNKNNKQPHTRKREFDHLSDQNSAPKIKKSMSDSKFRTYGMAPVAASPSFRR